MSKANGSKKVIRVMLCVPNEGHTLPEAYDNRIQMGFHLGGLQVASHFGIKEYDGVKYDYPEGVEYKFHWASVGRVLTQLARERLTEWALAGKCDYMLHIDDDMICPIDMFEKLVRHNVDVIAPLAFMRMKPHLPVIYRLEEGWDAMAKQEYYVTHVIKNYPKNQLVECDAVGFGAALIKMDVVKKMKPKYFMSTTGSGEDLFFCKKARDVGARIFMDTNVKLGHLGLPPIIEEKDYEKEFRTKDWDKQNNIWAGKERELTRAI